MKRRAVALVLATVVGAGLSACEPSQLGAAAIVDDQRITVSEVQGYLETLRAERAAIGAPTDLGADAARLDVERRVLELVFERAARELNIVVTEEDVEAFKTEVAAQDPTVGDSAQFAAQNNVTLASLDQLFRRFTIDRKISELITRELPDATPEQLDAEFAKRLIAIAQSMQIRINPRYGSFDPSDGQIHSTQFDFLRPPPVHGKNAPATDAG